MSTSGSYDKTGRMLRKLPWLSSLAMSLVWGSLYLTFGRLHGMWAMFDKQFPFFVAWVIGAHRETMTPVTGTLFALLDGALVGGGLGWLFRYVLLRTGSATGLQEKDYSRNVA